MDTTSRLVSLAVPAGVHMESQSGIQALDPRIYGRLAEPARRGDRRLAFVVMHPTSNFFNHYLLEPLAARGAAVLALNSRYVANDTMLLMERVIQDLGAGIRLLRAEGWEQVVLIGNSGGGALAALYQQQAERLTIRDTPDGRPIDLRAEQLPPADALALLCAHPGRAHTLAEWLDPSVTDEHDVLSRDPDLDLYAEGRVMPLEARWLAGYRDAQRARHRRITTRVLERLRQLDALPGAQAPRDEAFVIHRTMADPRFVDMTLDPSDRVPGTVWGPPQAVNHAPNNIARFSTLRSYLSQWSWDHTRARGPDCLHDTTVPVLNVQYTADQIVFPSHFRLWSDAASGRCTEHHLRGINHYPQGRPEAVTELADLLMDWSAAVRR